MDRAQPVCDSCAVRRCDGAYCEDVQGVVGFHAAARLIPESPDSLTGLPPYLIREPLQRGDAMTCLVGRDSANGVDDGRSEKT